MTLLRPCLALATLLIALPLSAGTPKKPAKAKAKPQVTTKTPQAYLEDARQLYRAYRINEAMDQIAEAMAAAKGKRFDDETMAMYRELHGQINRAAVMTDRADSQELLDSLGVPKADWLKHLAAYEPGLQPFQEPLPGEAQMPSVSYRDALERNQLLPSGQSLVWHSKGGGTWEPQPLSTRALDQEQPLICPILLEDGTTLLFGREGAKGIGGYDLYISRLRDGGGAFHEPTLLGMPYNSPYNDYLLSWHESEGWGTLVSDRFCGPDSVHIYRFAQKPSFLSGQTKAEPSEETAGEEFDFARASLSGLPISKDRAAAASPSRPSQKASGELLFVVQGDRIYRHWSDFRSPEAMKRYKAAEEAAQRLAERRKQLEELRCSWSASAEASTQRRELSVQIRQLETQLETAAAELEAQYQTVRRLEGAH